MSAAATDKFKKVGRSTATTLSSPGYTIGDVSITVGSTSNWPTSTGVTFAVDTVDGAGVQIAGTYNIFKGVVTSATQISSLSYVGGDANRNYTAGATTRVYIDIDYSRHNEMIDGIVAEHNQDGTHSDINADSITVTGTSTLGAVTATSLTLAGTATAEGWSPLGATPDTVTANGNNSFDLVFNSTDLTDTLTNGMRVRATRTVAAPNTAFSLDGTNDYYVKTSPNKLTFTDDFVCSAWVYLTSYQSGTIVSRYNGTSGWFVDVNPSGQLRIAGFNGGSSNFRLITSNQSLPLNKWVHIAAQLDMSTYTATTTTCYVMINGVDAPGTLSTSGTNPTALIQAGNLEIGSVNGGTAPFPGYIDQVAVYSAKVTQATILASINRALSGSETSLASAYSNGSVNDLNTTTPNNLTATNGATTVASSPFGNRGVSTTLEYGVVMANTFSTNTTLTIQVPEGCQLPTTGGITTLDYANVDVPYGFPRQKGKWDILMVCLTTVQTSGFVTGTWYNPNSLQLNVPKGDWDIGHKSFPYGARASAGAVEAQTSLSTSSSAEGDRRLGGYANGNNVTSAGSSVNVSMPVSLSSATPYYLLVRSASSSLTNLYAALGDRSSAEIYARNAYL